MNNMNTGADPAQGTGEKTFTQDDVNRIVQERLAKEKAKADNNAEHAKKEQELARRELRLTAREKLADAGLPAELVDALNCADQETLDKSITAFAKIFNDHKAKVAAPSGASPANGGIRPQTTEDAETRKAMGL